MRGEGRNVSRPVEFSAARPLLADKARREKSGLEAASPASTPPARSPQPSALSPRLADTALPSPGKSGYPGGPPRTAQDPRACGKKQNQKARQIPAGAREAPRRGSAPGQGWRCGERKRRRCHRRGPFVTVTLPSPASTPNPRADKSLPSPAAPAAEPLGERRQPDSPPLGRPLPSPRSPRHPCARPPARGSHRSQINKSACGRGRRACHGEGSQQSPPLLHGGGESP